MIQDAQVKYESTIRQHLAGMQKDGDGADKRFPQLYANVKRWQDQLEPVLKEFESRPEFDIHEYSTKFLEKMAGIASDIEFDGEGERLNGFKIKLLKAKKEWISLEGEEEGRAAAGAKGAAAGRKRPKAP